LLEKKTSLLNR